MHLNDHKDLWRRISEFAIDDPVASVKYSDKLAYHNGWSKEYTSRVIEEYKKFIFLCCILPKGASPSKPIDEAWHLHLTYTHNYWKTLCADILGKEIHHFPSKGGPDEEKRHTHWYNDTLDAYKEIFKQDAPEDIWIREVQPSAKSTLNDNAVADYFEWYKKYLPVFFTPFAFIGILYGRINPYQLTGPQFLVFFSCLIVTSIIYLLLIRSKKKREIESVIAEKYTGDADIYQLARFIYGRERSLRAAVVDLVERKILEPKRKSSFIFHVSNYKYLASEKNPLIIHLLRNMKDGETIQFTTISNYYDDASTYHDGLAGLYRSISVKDRWPILISAVILVIGIARIIQGAFHDKPVFYLFGLCMFYLIVTVVVISVSSGKSILQRVFENDFKRGELTEFQTTKVASVFVFFGLAYMSGLGGYSQLSNTFSRNNNSGSGSSGGCGSSGCGSDGGSCGGGGCGGCGGGGD